VEIISEPSVSVVMAVYNFNRMPMKGIETMLSQSMGDFEFILVDDGNHDGTERILAEYAAKDSRIRLIVNEKRLRLASSLNKATKLARADYIARADVNISYHRDRLKKQFDFIEKRPDIDILGSNFYWGVDGKEQVRQIILPEKHSQIIRRLSVGSCMCHPSIIFRREKLVPFGPYKEGFGWGEDYHLWMRTRNKLRFHNLQEFLLTKWHRPEPWKELSRIEYFKGNFLSRIAGFSTSPSVWLNITCFPMVFMSFISDTWIYRLSRSLRQRMAR
jgi:glycosyltransferase involved in cell wall biosynthesis